MNWRFDSGSNNDLQYSIVSLSDNVLLWFNLLINHITLCEKFIAIP